MAEPIEIVTDFCAEFSKGKDGAINAMRTWFTPAAIWENVGLATTTGIDEALAPFAEFERAMGLTSIGIEMLTIAATGNQVLTERIDRLRRADGSEIWAPKVMGIFEIEDGRIAAWRDYFDSHAAMALLQGDKA